MADIKTVATRASFGAALAELGAEREDFIVLDADLAAATKTGVFKKAFPERHIDCGIADLFSVVAPPLRIVCAFGCVIGVEGVFATLHQIIDVFAH